MASFLSGGFTTMVVINPPERKLAKRTSLSGVAEGLNHFLFKRLTVSGFFSMFAKIEDRDCAGTGGLSSFYSFTVRARKLRVTHSITSLSSKAKSELSFRNKSIKPRETRVSFNVALRFKDKTGNKIFTFGE